MLRYCEEGAIEDCFCDGQPDIVSTISERGNIPDENGFIKNTPKYYVKCSMCGSRIMDSSISKKAAIEKWNKAIRSLPEYKEPVNKEPNVPNVEYNGCKVI